MRRLQMFRDEQGMAMITAVLVMLAVAGIGTTAFQVSKHDLGASGMTRSRVQAVDAAEAGLDRFFLYVEQTSTGNMRCAPLTESLSTTPPATYTVTPTFVDANQNPLATVNVGGICQPVGTPAGVLLRSVGVEANSKRTMESFVRLSPATGGSFGNDAIFSNGVATFTRDVQITGSPDNADIYANDAISMTGGGTVWGSLRTQKNVVLSGSTQVKRDVLGKNGIVLSANAVVWGTVKSTTSTISTVLGTGGAQIKGDAYACTGIVTLGGLAVNGALHPTACPVAPAVRSLPSYTYNVGDWAGYQVQSFSGSGTGPCDNARNWITSNLINGSAAGNVLIRVAANCVLTLPTGQSLGLHGNLALVLDCGLSITGDANINNIDTGEHTLSLLTGLNVLGGCGNGGVTTYGNAFRGNLKTLIYTPGAFLHTGGSLVMKGQIYAGSVVSNGTLNLGFTGISVPGLPSGYYKQDIAYIREIS